MTAKALSRAPIRFRSWPSIASKGHALTARFTDDVPDFPYLLLLVSGDVASSLVVEGVGRYRRLPARPWTTPPAKATDKIAKLIGLGYPGGPAIERAALDGDAARFAFPRPLKGRPGCDYLFPA